MKYVVKKFNMSEYSDYKEYLLALCCFIKEAEEKGEIAKTYSMLNENVCLLDGLTLSELIAMFQEEQELNIIYYIYREEE